MIVIITGASHTGKTLTAQKILEKYSYPYLSLDLLKMGLIKSGYTKLTPEDDEKLKEYMWPIVRGIIKTAMENGQHLVIEGGYIPFGWEKSFSEEELKNIRYYCLIMSKQYIQNNFSKIKSYACEIEKRKDDSQCTEEFVIKENLFYLDMCKKYGYPFILIDKVYNTAIEL